MKKLGPLEILQAIQVLNVLNFNNKSPIKKPTVTIDDFSPLLVVQVAVHLCGWLAWWLRCHTVCLEHLGFIPDSSLLLVHSLGGSSDVLGNLDQTPSS